MESDATLLIPIFGIIFGCGLPVAGVILYVFLNYRKRVRLLELHHAERMAAIERGMELPPLPVEFIEGNPSRRNRTSLLPGLVWLFIGIALVIAFWDVERITALLGLIPTGVGLAFLIYYFVEGRTIESRLLESELSGRAARQIEVARGS